MVEKNYFLFYITQECACYRVSLKMVFSWNCMYMCMWHPLTKYILVIEKFKSEYIWYNFSGDICK